MATTSSEGVKEPKITFLENSVADTWSNTALKFLNCHTRFGMMAQESTSLPSYHFSSILTCLQKATQTQEVLRDTCQKTRSKWGTLILYIKIFQVFFTPSAAEHQRAGFSLECSVWGKFCLSPGQSSQQRSIGGSAGQDGIRNPLTQDCSSCSAVWGQIWSQKWTLKGSWRWQFHVSYKIFAFSGSFLTKSSAAPERQATEEFKHKFWQQDFLYTEQNTFVYLLDHSFLLKPDLAAY